MGGLSDGYVLFAGVQTAGRGRLGRQWLCGGLGESLMFSLLLKRALPELPPISLTAGLSVSEALSELYGVEIFVKWPNDIICGMYKICGISVEIKNNCCIVGIGVNISQPSDFFRQNGLENASSLLLQTDKIFTLETVAAHIINRFEQNLFLKPENILDRYRLRCLTLGMDIKIISEKNSLIGKAVGIDKKGALLADVGGQVITVNSGEISIRPTARNGYV